MKLVGRELLDRGWLSQYGREAEEHGLNKSEMEMCSCLGLSPAQFKASKDQLGLTEALISKVQPDARKSTGEDLTAEQLEMCRQFGITGEQFKAARDMLNKAS